MLEEIKSFIFSVDELNPKMVLVLTGYNDIARSYNKIIKVTNHEKREIDFFHWGLRNGLIYQSS